MAIPAPSAELEEQDIAVYCSGYLDHALLVLALEGLILRLATLLALWCCPRGLTLEPVVAAVGAGWGRLKTKLNIKKRPKRRTVTGGAAGAV